MQGHRQWAGCEAFPEQVNLGGFIFHQQDLWWVGRITMHMEITPFLVPLYPIAPFLW